MKNKAVTIIITLFSIVLLGIIGIQGWWIKRSFQLNKQQFDAAVYRSLESVVRQTEQKENYKFIQGNMDIDSVIRHDKNYLHKRIIVNKRRSFNIGTNGTRPSSIVSFASNKWQTVLSIENTQDGDFNTAQTVYIDSDDGNGDGEVNETINKVDTRVGNLYSLVAKMASLKNADAIEIRPNEIEELIRGQFIQNDLPDTFDFALLKSNHTFLYKSSDFIDTADCYKINLYPNDLFGRNIVLFVAIPANFQMHSATLWALALSLLFTITLLLLFMYSIKMLIRHKKLLVIKNDLINHMSHELKTPLAGISLGADMIMERADMMTKEQITKVAHSIKDQSNRLNKDMSAVLLSAMVDEAPMPKFHPFNIIDAIKKSLAEFEMIISQRNVRIETRFENDSIMVTGDETLWQKVFCNLVDNALKFSPERSPLLLIKVNTDKEMVHIQFTDNGIGISPDDIPHIFEKFYRSAYHRESKIQGFGLGLSFVKKVIDMHGAIIKAESEKGKGTTITIDLHTQRND